LEQINSLKAELAAIEGQPITETAVGEQDRIAEQVQGLKAMFDRMVQGDPQQPNKNTISKCCADCYLTQAIENDFCTLCGSTAKAWLLAEDEEPDAAGRAAYDERRMFKRMAAASSVQDLKIALRSGWARTPERQEFATRLLELRQAQKTRSEQPKVVEVPEPAQGITDESVRSAIRFCELQTAKLDQEIAKIDQEITERNKKA
jgi:hypothetical protein